MSKYMTKGEAMEYLRMGTTQFWQLTKERKIPYYQEKPGARMMFLQSDLDQYMDSIKVTVPVMGTMCGT